MKIPRREFLKSLVIAGAAAGTAAGASASLSPLPALSAITGESSAQTPGSFDFIFFTDTHIQPELEAAQGCDMCFHKMAAIPCDFAIHGGDYVFDALAVGRPRATQLFDLYARAGQVLPMPLHHTIGNHDVFGILARSGVAPSDPQYAKKMFQDRIGRDTFYSFDHKGYHFVVLDSIRLTADRMWEARVEDAQMEWLSGDLAKLPPGAPIVGVIHVPLATAFEAYVRATAGQRKYNTLTVANAPEVLALLGKYNVIAVLQGHTHINEVVTFQSTQYITSGAVCGNWWHGPRLGTPEGFTVVSLRAGKISTQYQTYGFHSIAPSDRF